MENLRPHHSCVCKAVYQQNGCLILLPELWVEADDQVLLEQLDAGGFVVTTDGQTINGKSELVIKDKKVFELLDRKGLLSYTVFSDEKYLNDLPVFFGDQWDPAISIESMRLLGWTVNKFTEPAFLFGFFPIQSIPNEKDAVGRNDIVGGKSTVNGEQVFGYEFLDKSVLNKWGLISEYENALQVAHKNTAEDPHGECWRPLALCVDEFTMKRLESYLE